MSGMMWLVFAVAQMLGSAKPADPSPSLPLVLPPNYKIDLSAAAGFP